MLHVSGTIYFSICIAALSYDGENFDDSVAKSECDHDSTMGLANYRNMALTTGSKWVDDCGTKTEVYDFDSNQWSNAPDYPFAK